MLLPQSWRHALATAWRSLWRAPVFCLTAVAILATGIGSAALMLAITHGVLLRPLPVRDAGRLIVAWKTLPATPDAHHPFGADEIDAVARASTSFAAVAGVDANGLGRELLQDGDEASLVATSLVSGPYFEVLGVTPRLGRVLGAADDLEGAEPVVVISHAHWQRRYGGATDVLGRRITLGDQRFTIVGVMAADLDFPAGVQLWRTTRSVPTVGPFGDAARQEIDLVARLKPGVTIEHVAEELAALTRHFETTAPAGATRHLTPVVRTFTEVVVGDVGSTLLALLAAVGLVLLIAAANVANLLLLRAERRRGELALREVLGASRARIAGVLLGEGLILGGLSAVAGLALTALALPVVLRLLPVGLPRIDVIRLDAPVVVATCLASVVVSMAAAVLPMVWHRSRNLRMRLRHGERGSTRGASRHVRQALVAAQVALAIVVVAAAALLTRGLLHLQHVPTGLDTERLVHVTLGVPPAQLADRAAHAQRLERLTEQLGARAPIAAVTPVHHVPFADEGGWDVPRYTAEGQSVDEALANPWLNLESAYPNHFVTLGAAMARGRAFTRADRQDSTPVAIVSEDVAERTWPGVDPIGKRLKMGGPDSKDRWRTVVGVARTTRYRDLMDPRPTLYLPAAQFIDAAQGLAIRTTASLDVIADLVRADVASLGPSMSVVRVSSFGALIDRPLARPRFNALVLSAFATTSLLLAMVGLYAVTAASVRSRRSEIAVRVAIGAQVPHIRALVLGETMRVVGVGVAVGLAGAAATARLVAQAAHLPVTSGTLTTLVAVLLLGVAAMLATWWPVREATRVDPATALKSEG